MTSDRDIAFFKQPNGLHMSLFKHMNHNMSSRTALLLVFVCPFLWAIKGVLIKLIDWNPFAIAGIRSFTTALVILLWLRGRPKFTFSFYQIGAALLYATFYIMMVNAFKFTTAANAAFLFYTNPIYTALLSPFFLREPIKKYDWLVIFSTLVGMSLFFCDQLSLQGLQGNLLAIIAAVLNAIFFIFSRLQKDTSPLESYLLGEVLIFSIGLPFILKSEPGGIGWPGLITMGILLGITAIILATAFKIALVTMLEPVLTSFLVMFVVGEKPAPWAIVGACVIMVSIFFHTILSFKKADQPILPAQI